MGDGIHLRLLDTLTKNHRQMEHLQESQSCGGVSVALPSSQGGYAVFFLLLCPIVCQPLHRHYHSGSPLKAGSLSHCTLRALRLQ